MTCESPLVAAFLLGLATGVIAVSGVAYHLGQKAAYKRTAEMIEKHLRQREEA